jgi:hypothetical protein
MSNRDVFRRGDEVIAVDYNGDTMVGATRYRDGAAVEVSVDKEIVLSWLKEPEDQDR